MQVTPVVSSASNPEPLERRYEKNHTAHSVKEKTRNVELNGNPNGEDILIKFKLKLNQNLNFSLYRKITWKSCPIKISIRLCHGTVRYRDILFPRFGLVE